MIEMTDYNEFNWNEDEPQVIETQSKPVYTESVLKPKSGKKKRGGRTKLVVGVICGALAGSMLSTTLVLSLFSVNPKNNTVTIYESGAKKTNAEATKVSTVVNEQGKELSISEIAQTVGPAVIGISCTVTYTSNYGYFFGGTQQGQSSGSGIIISDNGHIVTNYHVIEGASDITVKFNNGDECPATVVGGDKETDIAVIKIDPVDNMCVATLGDSDLVEVGDLAVAIGNPLGDELFGTVTSGIISGKNRTVKVDDREMTLLQTDAAINPGNSGGALINKYGEVIGINSVKIASSSNGSSSEGLGFAI
ncbi:MAG: S1C family serine protease, partial [Clostridia bacterium]